jgi:hypothetical protein
MNNIKNILALLAAGIVIGVILTVTITYVFDAKPETITVGPVAFKIPTEIVSQTPELSLATAKPSPTKPYPTPLPLPTNTLAPPTIAPTATPVPTPTPDPRLFWDDFQSGVKPDWKILSGRCNMVSGTLKCPTVPARFEVGSNDWANYRVEFDTGEYWKFHEGVIVMVKLAKNGSHLSLHLPPCGTAFWTYANSNGSDETVANTAGGVCEHGPFHVIIECNGDIYTTMINGKVVSTFQETRAPNGRIGFYTDIDNSEIWFDNVSVSIVN